MKLNGKIAVITGGASGIGAAGTHRFCAEGATVIMIDVNEAAGMTLENELCASGGEVLFIKADISNATEVESAMQKIDSLYGRVDIIYNNASVFLGGRDGYAIDIPLDIWQRILSINLSGTFYCIKYGLPLLRKAGGGSIINTASSAGVVGVPGCDAYTATKGAIVSLTKSLAVEYGKVNIRTNCIAPAAIETDMVKQSNLNDPNFDDSFFKKQITPLGRWGKPQDVAALACFLASDDANYLNGVVIPCDGGITINGNVNKEK